MKMLSLLVLAVILAGCGQPSTDHRVNVSDDIGEDTLGSNIITRPIGDAVNIIVGRGIVITKVSTARNDSGFMTAQVRGINNSVKKVQFEYKIDWLNENGMVLDAKTDNWRPASAMPKSDFYFNAVAPRTEATDFRINTRISR